MKTVRIFSNIQHSQAFFFTKLSDDSGKKDKRRKKLNAGNEQHPLQNNKQSICNCK